MAYIGLGARAAKGAADTTGFNTGKWTVTFDSNLMNINQPFFECYKIVVTGAATSATFNVYVNTNLWDPSQPLVMRPGDTLYFYYSSASSDGNQPLVTAWFRYDPVFTQVYGLTGSSG